MSAPGAAPRFIDLFELQDAGNSRWPAMEGLRGLAVILVFFVHYSALLEHFIGHPDEADWWLVAIGELGATGVDLFFVLSGFLIYKTCVHRPIDLGRYARRRVERIYPAFITVFALYTPFSLLGPQPIELPVVIEDRIAYIVANLLLLPGVFDIKPIIAVAWSLSYEVAFYILAPLAVVGLSMRRWAAWWRLGFIGAVCAAMVGLRVAGHLGDIRPSMFLGGMVVYELGYHLMRSTTVRARGAALDVFGLALLIAAIAGCALLGHSRWIIKDTVLHDLPSFFRYLFLNVALVLVLYRCLFASGLAARIFSWTPLRWLGNMSYSFYLFHAVALQTFFFLLAPVRLETLGNTMMYLYLLPPAFIVSVALSIPLFVIVERPLSLKPKRNGTVAAGGVLVGK
jgi:peptidoglycan/LPS O-acetylase OafA/YrhL